MANLAAASTVSKFQ